MCGIVGYCGEQAALDILLDGLKSLEYRGYDSAGIALVGDGLEVLRRAGKVSELVAAAATATGGEHTGIGHTRWATCGPPTERNAHPHSDCGQRLAVVHNGIIENHLALRDELEAAGHVFKSETDTETIVHLIESFATEGHGLLEATRRAVGRLEGSFALAVVDAQQPDRIVAARMDAPLIVGFGEKGNFIASDFVALVEHTRRIAPLTDGQLVEVRSDALVAIDMEGNPSTLEEIEVSWSVEAAEKGGYDHFMLKEIHEQPTAIRETLRGRSDASGKMMLDELRISDEDVRNIDKVFVVACGSSFHAGLVAKYAIEHWSRLPVEIDVASEFRYRDPVLGSSTLVVGISQSGETADTLAAVRYARQQRAKVIAITNVVGSSITREADAVLYTHAGPEVGVAATKTLTTQMVALWLLALWLSGITGTHYPAETADILQELHLLPERLESILKDDSNIRAIADRFAHASTYLFIGRGVGYPVALEGALKLKELSYLHAEGFAAGEMKHGPIALLESGVPVVAVATASHVQAKLLSNAEEAKARGAKIIAIVTQGDSSAADVADQTIEVPAAPELLSPVLDVVPLQLFAYYIAIGRGLDPDKPRNLAKSVTVE